LRHSVRKFEEHIEPKPEKHAELSTTRPRRTVRNKPSPALPTTPDDDPGPVRPEHEPLRSRPLNRLNLDDFRIDPTNNDQRDYAYSETVRKRGDRSCLPGCTKACCSGFLKLAAANVLPNASRRSGLFHDASDGLDDDELTLRGYLGRGYTQMTHDATPEEKKNMLIQARAEAFADQFGKHRQAFQRRNTPPGFWRTDMPTTQEEEEDREAAMRMERQRVEERYREAMRGGGRWIFRDE